MEPTAPQKTYADKVSSWIIVCLMFLLPTFFIPSAFVSFQFTKIMIVYVGVIAALIAWIIGRLKDGKIYVSRPADTMMLVGIVVIYAVASLFSPTKSVSFMGQGFEIGTFSFILVMAILLFLISNLFTESKQSFNLYFSFLCSFIVVCLYQLARLLLGPGFMSFGIFNNPTNNLIGSWSDLGIYFGAIALFSFITLELLNLPKWGKVVCGIVLGVSLFLLSVIGFKGVWIALGLFSLIFFVYNFSFNKSTISEESPVKSADGKRTIPLISLVVLIISFALILNKGNLYSTISSDMGFSGLNRFAISSFEFTPTWLGTLSVSKTAMSQHPFFGMGPNRFVNAWLLAKDTGVNNSIFWSTDFNYGIGLIPTFLATTGVIGFLFWIAFIALFLYQGFKVLFSKRTETFSDYISISSFIIALYFWIFAFFHVPSAELIVCMFAFTGIFLASSIKSYSLIPPRVYNIVKDPRTSFISVLILIGLLLCVLVFGYSIGKRYVAHIYFNKALFALNSQGDIVKAESNMNKALKFAQNDLYYRNLAELNIIKINGLMSQNNLSQDAIKSQFQDSFAVAQNAIESALKFDSTNYENWMVAGHLYETILPLGAPKAYEEAIADYKKAQSINPLNPSIFLTLARLELVNKNIPQAKKEIENALKIKSNYTDAMYLLAQIQANEGDLKSAVASVEAATLMNPSDSTLFFQLGLLRYNNKDFSGAVSAFGRAIELTPDYANAKYFMALSYLKLGQKTKALENLKAIQVSNSDNKDLNKLISNIEAGRDPFSSIQNQPTAKIDKNTKPPIKEKDSSEKNPPETAGR